MCRGNLGCGLEDSQVTRRGIQQAVGLSVKESQGRRIRPLLRATEREEGTRQCRQRSLKNRETG